jgi:myo-inositol-1-phosphate synthase
VCIVGSSGAVATTALAGAARMRKWLAPREGMITETAPFQALNLAPINGLVFGGWDARKDDAYVAALEHAVVDRHLLAQVRDELEAIKPWPSVVSPQFIARAMGTNHVVANSFREELAILEQNIEDFKRQHTLERVVIINLASTERYCQVEDVHRTIKAFEAGLDANDPRISPAMKYLYLACKLRVPHVNFTPSLTKIPALEELAVKNGVPIAGEDGKTGQTMIKTVLAPAFAVRQLRVAGWYSTNILGNSDGLVLDDPGSNRTKITSKKGVLDDILGYPVPNHYVRIDYYPPRGDAKEAWDNIDLVGFLGERMQLKVNFLCKDSILAAPLVIDLVRLVDRAKRAGEAGIQRQLSLFFKAPYHTDGEQAVNDLFKQHALLSEWIADVARRTKAKGPRADLVLV